MIATIAYFQKRVKVSGNPFPAVAAVGRVDGRSIPSTIVRRCMAAKPDCRRNRRSAGWGWPTMPRAGRSFPGPAACPGVARGTQVGVMAQRASSGVDRGDGSPSGSDCRARLALPLGLRLGAFIKGVFKDLFPGERVDGGRLVHLICRLGQGHLEIPRPA
jgi:hypothetical protein